MKNITLSANEVLIQKARQRAGEEHTTLNALFREWLESYVSRPRTAVEYVELMERLSYADPGGTFSRDEMNER